MKFKAAKPMDGKRKIWLNERTPEVVGVFAGEPHEFKIHWVDGKKLVCTSNGCESCKMKIDSKFQFALNFIHRAQDGTMQASVYENDWFTYERLCKLNDEFPLEKNLVKIHKGEVDGYSNRDLFQRVKELDTENLKMVDQIELIHLDETQNPYAGQTANESDIPF